MLGLAMVLAAMRAPLGDLPSQPLWYGDIIFSVAMAVSLIVGGFVASRLPRNPYGWLLMAFGFGIGSLQGLAQNYGIASFLIAPSPLPLSTLVFVLPAVGFALTMSSIPLLFLLFPSGRLPSRRWRFMVWGVAASFVVLVALLWLAPSAVFLPVPSPFHLDGARGATIDAVTSTAILFLLFAILVSAISVVIRGVRAKGAERQQFKWLGLASILIVLALFFQTELVPLLPGVLDILVEALAFAAVPAAVGIAVLRYRLWDIDVVIRKTLLYGVLTVLLGTVYAALVIAFQGVFSRVTGQDSNAAVVLSTLVIAALFTPLRRWVQNLIDRRFYRRKYDAERVLEQFAATARDETDLDRLTDELLRVIRETMQPDYVGIWLRDATTGVWSVKEE